MYSYFRFHSQIQCYLQVVSWIGTESDIGILQSCIQGVSYWNEQSNLALTGVRIDNFIDLMCSVNAWGYDILIFATSFQKSAEDFFFQKHRNKADF